MKKLSFVFTFAAILAFSTMTNAQKKYLSGADIPNQITSYVEKYFPDATIRKVKEEKEPLKTEYEVKLDPKAELEFDGNYQVTEIEAKSGVPTEALPQKVKDYIAQKYPNETVKEWKVKSEGQKVKLRNGKKLYFDPQGSFAGEK